MNSEVIEIFEMITSLKDYNVQNKNKIKHDEYLKKKPNQIDQSIRFPGKCHSKYSTL